MALWFDEEGWLHSDEADLLVEHNKTHKFSKGMHSYIKKNFGNQLHGTITHYDALPSARRTIQGMTSQRKTPSTHFIIARDGRIHQLVSIHDRAWHAAFKRLGGKVVEWPKTNGRMPMGNGHTTGSPNQWFIGIDLSNWGKLDGLTPRIARSWTGEPINESDVSMVRGVCWERYRKEATDSYVELLAALILELDLKKNMHYRHSDTSPTRKVDPGPAFDFTTYLNNAYHCVDTLDRIFDLDNLDEENEEP